MQVPVELKIKYLSRRMQDIEKLADYLEPEAQNMLMDAVKSHVS